MPAPAAVPLSVLDLAPIREGSTAEEALRRSLELAPVVEALGYRRIWVAEHHNIPGVASSAAPCGAEVSCAWPSTSSPRSRTAAASA